MKFNIQKMIVALCLCMGIATVSYASGGTYDYNSGTASNRSTTSAGNANNATTVNNQEYIFDLRVSTRKKNDAPATMYYEGRTYNKINVDLNKGAGGKYIYLYYTTTTNPNTALVDIIVTTGLSSWWEFNSAERTGRSFANNIWSDLNEGAGGNYIYLGAYRAGYVKMYGDVAHTFTGPAIKAVTIVYSDNAMSSYPGWEFHPIDLNRGAGGKYIYICHRR